MTSSTNNKSSSTNSYAALGKEDYEIYFPYIRDQIDAIKRVPGAKWDASNRCWRVPLRSQRELLQFLRRYGFHIDSSIYSIDLPQHPIGESRLELSTTGKYLLAFFPYDPVKVQAIKRVPGASFDRSKKAWKIPTGMWEHAIEFAETYKLPYGEEIQHEIEIRKHFNGELLQLSSALDWADLQVPEQLGGELLHFQRAAVEYVQRTRRTFIADTMGLGKTIEAIASIEYLDAYPAVVSCPPSLVLNWEHEIKTWTPHRTVGLIQGRSGEKPDTDWIVIGDANLAHWEDQLKKPQGFVVDESHRMKNPGAQRTKAATKIAKSVPKGGAVLLLTGTPITNRPAEFASQLDIIGRLQEFGGKWPFLKRYAAAWRDKFGWNTSGASHLEELNAKLRSICYIRRTKEEALPELPPVRRTTLYVEPDPAVMPEYWQAEEDIARYMAERAAEIAKELGLDPRHAAVMARLRAEANEHLVRIAALKRIAAKAKVEAAKDWIDSHIDEGLKVVVAAHHREVVSGMAKKYGGLMIQGGQKTEDVEAAKKKFQNLSVEEAPVMVVSITAGGLGHTLTAAQDMLFMELPWTPADVDQTISRCHRLGQQGSVLATAMLAEGTIDERIWGLLESKRRVVDAATEGVEITEEDTVGDLLVDFAMMGMEGLGQ